ncbi:DUF6297 family protein [Actinocatenispora rupis]|uniref:Uncharacterized protein n=1 Tax=Actinocatenispora rupis TaxID=519421 RepID=A0A8J3IX39_9ACTN|nr:DUF6297 family protein [Actinocatenispora rupis]GID10283.1 hypothetical protein Aru02nite_11720 [Actinocatenispora rupis]
MTSPDPVLTTPRPEPVDTLDRATVAARTRETLALLRRLRRAHLREQAGSAAFAAYATAIGLLVYGGALLPWLRRLSAGQQQTTDAAVLGAAAPPALIALTLLLFVAVLRDALWRGPVTVPVPAASWLLPLPIDRGRILRPRLRNQLVIGAVGGAVLGVAVAVALTTGGLAVGRFGPLLGASAGGFAAAGVLSFGVSALVERYQRAARLVRLLAPVAVLVAVALGVQAGLAAYGHDLPVLVRVETWTGPWGWAVQPVLAVTGPVVPGWPVGFALLVVAALAAAVVAMVVCPGVSGRTLRIRARSVAGFTAGLTTLNPRAAALEIRAARSRPARTLRLPRPHHPRLIIPWRDATALVRSPSRPAWAVLLTAVGFLLIRLSTGAANLYLSLALLAAGLVAGYLAAAQLTEPARLDADDPRRAGSLPYAFDRLALRHVVVPLVVAGVLAEVCAVVAVALTGSVTALLVPVICVPALVFAALVSAYRGPVPAAAMNGPDTPAGNLGMVTVVAWYVAGPLVAVVLLLPPMHLTLGAHAPGSVLNYVLWGLAVAAILAFWSVRRAHNRANDIHP